MGRFLMQFQRLLFIIIVLFMTNMSNAISSDGMILSFRLLRVASVILSEAFNLNFCTGEVLLSIKTAIIGSDGIFLNWRQEDPDPCNWKGVTCDTSNKRIIYL